MAGRQDGDKPQGRKVTTVDIGDLTLDELDQIEALRAEHPGLGYTVAAATVWFRRTRPSFSVDEGRKLRSRDVVVRELPAEVAADDVPTSGRS